MVDGWTEIDDVLGLVRSYREFMTGLAARSKPLKLSADGCLILLVLRDRGGASNTDLADALGLNLSTATKIVDRLVSDNFVHRKPHPTDRRRIQIYLTEEGSAAVRRAVERFGSFMTARPAPGGVASLRRTMPQAPVPGGDAVSSRTTRRS